MKLDGAFWRRRRPASAGWLSTDGRAMHVRSDWVRDVEVSSDSTAASWLSGSLDTPWREGLVRVGAVIPSGFDAYLRIDHASTDDRDDRREGGVPRSVAQMLVRVLAAATTTSGNCWMAVWNGWGGMPAAPSAIHLPGRDYVLLSGKVHAAGEPLWSYDGDAWDYQSPSLWWSDDRSWCVATEVDFAWTYVGCLESVAETLCRDRNLSTRRVRLEDDANA